MFDQPIRVLESAMKFLFLDGFEQSAAENLDHFPMMEVFVRELQLGFGHVASLKRTPKNLYNSFI